MITRRLAGWGCSIMLITCIFALVLAIQDSIKWLMIVSIIGIIIYIIGILIVLIDKYG